MSTRIPKLSGDSKKDKQNAIKYIWDNRGADKEGKLRPKVSRKVLKDLLPTLI
jgi:hypothetical protein